jgi:DNA-binding NtrC family response regulator
VVIRGATGTGKSHVAQLIHRSSNLAGDDQTLHCSSILDEPACRDAVIRAAGKSLVIESLPALPASLQQTLLNTLDHLGTEAPRLIVTTGEDGLLKEAADGRVDQELYYRIQILEVALPPLRDRLEDIPAISACFLGELDATTATRIDDAVLDLFAGHDWPGNLRELRNVINFALVTSGGAPVITRQHVPSHLLGAPTRHTRDHALGHVLECWIDRRLESDVTYKDLVAELEDILLRNLLRRFDGKSSHLASALSINRSTGC